MRPTKRYAEGTTVPVSKSRMDMQGLLDSNGCTAFGFEKIDGGDALYFKLGGRSYLASYGFRVLRLPNLVILEDPQLATDLIRANLRGAL